MRRGRGGRWEEKERGRERREREGEECVSDHYPILRVVPSIQANCTSLFISQILPSKFPF